MVRLGSNCTTLLVQHIVNLGLVKQEQRDRRIKQQCCTNNVVQFDPSLNPLLKLLLNYQRAINFFRVLATLTVVENKKLSPTQDVKKWEESSNIFLPLSYGIGIRKFILALRPTVFASQNFESHLLF